MRNTILRIASSALILTLAAPAPAQAPNVQERVAALKASVQKSQAQLRRYEWIETTILKLKGDEKSRKQNRCYYGADGKLQKVPVGAEPEGKSPRGVRGRVAKRKKEDIQDYMERAADLAHRYVPPDPQRIQQAKDAGKVSIHVLEPGRRAALEFRDYLQPGDSFTVEVDLQCNQILALRVASYLDEQEDTVTLNVRFSALQDGTNYAETIVLDAKAKNVQVTVQNSGYRLLGS